MPPGSWITGPRHESTLEIEMFVQSVIAFEILTVKMYDFDLDSGPRSNVGMTAGQGQM